MDTIKKERNLFSPSTYMMMLHLIASNSHIIAILIL